MYQATRLLQDDHKTTDEALQELTALLPAAWQYPEITAARLAVGDIVYTTNNYVPSP